MSYRTYFQISPRGGRREGTVDELSRMAWSARGCTGVFLGSETCGFVVRKRVRRGGRAAWRWVGKVGGTEYRDLECSRKLNAVRAVAAMFLTLRMEATLTEQTSPEPTSDGDRLMQGRGTEDVR